MAITVFGDLIGIVGGAGLAGGVIWLWWIARRLPRADQAGPATYTTRVRVMMRYQGGGYGGYFVGAKNGSGWLTLTVRGHLIFVSSPGWPRTLAAMMGLEHVVDAREVEVTSTQISRAFGIPDVGPTWVVLIGRDMRRRNSNSDYSRKTETY